MNDKDYTLDLWDSVSKTNPKYTKRVEQKGGYTAINPYYQIKEATKLWGPYGNNWGLEEIEFNYEQMSSMGLVIMQAVFYCPESRFKIHNAIEPVSVKGRRDPDFMKKLETDTITKALSRLGFNSDVFMAQFDDADYVAMRGAEANLEEAEDRQSLLERKFNEIKNGVERSIGTIKACPTQATVENVKQKTLAKARRELAAYKYNPNQFDNWIEGAASNRLAEIQQLQGKR